MDALKNQLNMRNILKSVSMGGLFGLMLMGPGPTTGSNTAVIRVSNNKNTAPVNNSRPVAIPSTTTKNAEAVMAEARIIYDSMHLRKTGLSKKAFEYAWTGYQRLLKQNRLYRESILSICDFSQSSRRKRLYIFDVESKKLLLNTYVAHGRNSGGEYARAFSNRAESHQSSLGFYLTRNTYFGDHGLALKIEGLEKGFNDKADERNIVVHGSDYVGAKFLRNNPFNGRSFGCPAVPSNITPKVIHTIKNGSCPVYISSNKKISESIKDS